jgi:hypothetical protein
MFLQIEIKLKRALHGFFTDKDDYLPGDYQTDFNGSGKNYRNWVSIVHYKHLKNCMLFLQTNNPLLKIKWDYWNRFAQKPMSNSPTWMHLNDRVLMSSNDITISRNYAGISSFHTKTDTGVPDYQQVLF